MDRSKKSGQVTYQDLVRVEKPSKPGEYYPNWSENPITKKKVWRKGGVTIRTPHTSLRDAEKYRDAEMIRRSGLNPQTVKRKQQGVTSPLISDVWSDLVKSRPAGDATLEKYNQSWKHAIEPFWGNKTVGDVSQPMQLAFEAWYMKNRSTKQYFNVHKHLGMLFRYMMAHEYIAKVPMMVDLDERIDKIVQRKTVGRVYTPDEQAALMKAITTPYPRYKSRPSQVWPWQIKARVAVLFGLQAGLRQMEACKVKREKLDLINGVATVWSDKNGYWRPVPIGPDLIAAIKELIKISPQSEWLFPMPTDPSRHQSAQLFDDAWVKAKKRAGIIGGALEARFHDLRHTFATLTSEDNWPVKDACELLDMSAAEYMKTYVHTKQENVRARLAKSLKWGKR